MEKSYTRAGDDGYSGLLGEERVAKYHSRLETVGAVDEATAALGVARANCQSKITADILLTIQRDLYNLMAEIAATPENAPKFRKIDSERVVWLEECIDEIGQELESPNEFIIPGDSQPGAAMALARTIVRRAERWVAKLFHQGQIENNSLLQYLNRLSSLCFVLELYENRLAGTESPTLVK